MIFTGSVAAGVLLAEAEALGDDDGCTAEDEPALLAEVLPHADATSRNATEDAANHSFERSFFMCL
ncbi:hypothetical protein J2Z45_003288 [Cohnella lubricantis]|nr:hypothetical protein [Cohnella lubricantis]